MTRTTISIFMALFFFTSAFSQIENKIRKNIDSLSQKYSIKISQEATNEIVSQYKKTANENFEYNNQLVINRLDEYFRATSVLGESSVVDIKETANFTWLNLDSSIIYFPVKIIPKGDDKISNVRIISPRFGESLPSFTPCESKQINLAIPIIPQKTNEYDLEINTASGKKMKYFESIYNFSIEEFKNLRTISISQFDNYAKFDIQTEPEGATIYFNKKKYYRKTNSTSARPPGKYQIKLVLKGYRGWNATRQLQKGEIWAINVNLEKELKLE